jgi:hypothetical protein
LPQSQTPEETFQALETVISPDQEYARNSGGIHEQDEQGVDHTDLAENSDNLIEKHEKQR